MSTRARLTGSIAVAVGLMTSFLVVVMAPAPAMATVDNAAIKKSFCSKAGANGLNWRGRGNGGYPDASNRSLGQTGYCVTSYKIRDGDKRGYDYYAVEMTVNFIQKGIDYPSGPATVTVTSNRRTQQNYYAASSGKSTTSCKSFELGVGYGVLSAAVPFRICDSASVTRSATSAQGATYKADDVSKVKTMSFVFMQKVKAGVKPTFSGILRFPFYEVHAPDAQHSYYWYTYSYGQTTWGITT